MAKKKEKDRAGKGKKLAPLFKRLRGDHRGVAELLEDRGDLEDRSIEERREWFVELRVALLAHAIAEDEVVYAALEAEGGELERLVLASREEHAIVQGLVDGLARLDPAEPRWLAKVKVLADLVEHHVDEEEDTMFGEAQDALDEDTLEELLERFDDARERARDALAREDGGARAEAAEAQEDEDQEPEDAEILAEAPARHA